MLGQQVLGAGIADVSGIANIADIADVADIATDIADIVTDIADIVNIADIADRMLRTLRWKQVGAYKVLRGCPVTQRDGGFCVSLFGKAVKCKVALLYYKIEDLAWRLMAAKTEYDF